MAWPRSMNGLGKNNRSEPVPSGSGSGFPVHPGRIVRVTKQKHKRVGEEWNNKPTQTVSVAHGQGKT
ncbi:hypothetical protein NEUTE1DRAFT_117542, partial [Neurospora tetrasperma FGSC 2508]